MKVFMVWKYYPQYLSYFYEKHTDALKLPFCEHREMIFDDHFGWPADLSRYMNAQGIKTEFVVANAEVLQKQWALENNFRSYSYSGWEKEIVLEQIKRFRPDILWIPLTDYFGDFVKSALSYCKKAITWVSSKTRENLDVSGISELITSHPNMLKKKQHLFKRVIITKPGFDQTLLDKLGAIEKKYDVVFIGQVSQDHQHRAEILAYLIENGIDVKMFGFVSNNYSPGKMKALRQSAGHVIKRGNIYKGFDVLKRAFIETKFQRDMEIIKSAYQAPVFGLDMYRTLGESRISLNVHIDVADNYSGNMRMFETTGVGSCLVTERFGNINKLFEPGKEIMTYNTKEESLEILQEMLSQNEKTDQIARSGQKRTLQDYTLEKIFNDLKVVFDI